MRVTVILPANYDNDWIRTIIAAFDALGWDVQFGNVQTFYTQPYWYSSGTTTGKQYLTNPTSGTLDIHLGQPDE